MPNRLIRDCTDSEAVNKLSDSAEKFFFRLLMKADDFGCYFAEPRLLHSHLYPYQLDRVKPADVAKYLEECCLATNEKGVALVRIYEVAGKKFVFVNNFGQRLRQKNRKFPAPPEEFENQNDEKVRSIGGHSADIPRSIGGQSADPKGREGNTEGRSLKGSTKYEGREGNGAARADICKILWKHLRTNQELYYPGKIVNYKKAFEDLESTYSTKLVAAMGKPDIISTIEAEFKKKDDALFMKFIGGLMKKEVEKMYNYYAARGFKLGGDIPITDWDAAMGSWMTNDYSKKQ